MTGMTSARSALRLGLSGDELQLQASVERLIQKEYGFERRRAGLAAGGFDPAFWQQIADLGWLGACFPEALGGYAQSANEALIILEQFGRGLVLEPLLGAVLVPCAALLAAEDNDRHGELLTQIMAGERLLALAWTEPGRRYGVEPLHLRATPCTGGWRLQGKKAAVLNAPQADSLIVSAATDQGPALFLVPGRSDGLSLNPHSMIDGQPAADLAFNDVQVGEPALIAGPATAGAALAAALDWGAAGACAEALGAMNAALDMTVEYAKTRQQFGQPIAGFQVVQHRLAAMAIELEYCQSLLPLLCAHLDGQSKQRSATISAIRARITSGARRVVADAVQLHGGIGVTDEAAISHYFRRVTALELAWGGSRLHLERYRRRRAQHDLLLA